MKMRPKLNLIDRLKRNPQLQAELTAAAKVPEALLLNYRWEQKINEHDSRRKSKERAYIELILEKEQRNEHGIRLYYVKVTRNLSEVQQLMPKAARSIHAELQKLFAPEQGNLTFQGYYLKGERQEYRFGKIE